MFWRVTTLPCFSPVGVLDYELGQLCVSSFMAQMKKNLHNHPLQTREFWKK